MSRKGGLRPNVDNAVEDGNAQGAVIPKSAMGNHEAKAHRRICP